MLRYLPTPYQPQTYKAQKEPRCYESLYAPQKFIVVVKTGELKIRSIICRSYKSPWQLQKLNFIASTAEVMNPLTEEITISRIKNRICESPNQQQKLTIVELAVEVTNRRINSRSYDQQWKL